MKITYSFLTKIFGQIFKYLEPALERYLNRKLDCIHDRVVASVDKKIDKINSQSKEENDDI